jgi:hypothetical protein
MSERYGRFGAIADRTLWAALDALGGYLTGQNALKPANDPLPPLAIAA